MVSAEESAAAAAEAEASDRGRIAKAAAIIMVGTILSRLLGLGREQISSWLFGTGDPIAAFTIADNIQTILYNLVMSGMMEAALVPVLTAYAVPELRQELRRIVGALLVLALIVIGAAVVLMEIFAPAVVVVMTAIGGDPGAHGAATLALTLTLVRMILPAVLLLALSTILMSTLYALHRFARPAMSLAVRNAAVVVTALVLGGTAFGVRSLALGLVIGAALLFALMLPGLRDALPRPNLDFHHPAVRRILALYLPIAIGLVSNTVALVIDRNLAWGAGPNALGGMRYATTLNQLILGIVAAATSLAALPTLSRHFNNGDEDAYQRTLANGLKMVTVMVVPATFGMAAIAWPTVDLLFFHGATTLAGAQAILVALLGYLPGTFFAAFDQVLIFGYYARQNTTKPVVVGVIAVGVYLAVALPLVHPLGMLGLVLANSAQFTFHALAMWWLMHHDLGRVGDATVGRTIRVAVAVGVVMAAAVFALARAIEGVPLAALALTPGGSVPHRLAAVALPVAVGAAVYVAGLHLFGVDEVRTIQRGLSRRLGRAAR
ncbi:MAG TPA: murein biosynthesis integral membrane protein MurJ [Thermomicrobiaceae bacterium]|nr:murein biosynthesis integral membrane protein MurJ [Thermomicrobiaceae bacterium]